MSSSHHQRQQSSLYDPFNGKKYHYSLQACQLIKDLLQVNDKKRITAAQVLDKYRDWFALHDAIIF